MRHTTDSVPAVQQSRAPPASLTGLPRLPPTASSYRFVVFHWGIFTITRRSLALASSAASLTFLALQVRACICLVHAWKCSFHRPFRAVQRAACVCTSLHQLLLHESVVGHFISLDRMKLDTLNFKWLRDSTDIVSALYTNLLSLPGWQYCTALLSK